MTISVGDKLPDATFKIMSADGARDITTDEIFAGRKVILIGVPDAITTRGVDEIAMVSVNDHHVMAAWARATGAEGKILFLADGNGAFVRAIGLNTDMSDRGMGTRSKRFSMVVEDGRVTALNIEEAPGQAVESGAARMLEQI